jgi:hypothetical protein
MAKKRSLFFAALLLLFSLACGLGSQNLSPMSETLTPLSAEVAGTVTAQAANVGGADDQLATSYAQATATDTALNATLAQLAAVITPNPGTATAIAPALAELPFYQIDPSQGYVAWVHRPVTIELNGYQQSDYKNDYQGIVARDFVMSADITWHTYNSLSACGFMFRSNGDTNKPTQYMVVITRFATGYLAFTATVKGETSNMRTIYPYSQDKSFTWQNDATNRLAIVVRGQNIDAYTNQHLVGQIDSSQPPPNSQQTPPKVELTGTPVPQQLQDYQNLMSQDAATNSMINDQMATASKNFAKNKPILDEGFLGFIGVSQSGQTTCTFSNGWLFILR